MFLYSVPAAQRSMPDRSKPCWVTLPSIGALVGSPGIESMRWWLVRSKCTLGVMRMVIGIYEGFCQMGESLSFMSWYPLSRKFCPKLFSSGHAVWQAEQGRSYFRAKAGMARTRFTGSAEMGCLSLRTIDPTIPDSVPTRRSSELWCLLAVVWLVVS